MAVPKIQCQRLRKLTKLIIEKTSFPPALLFNGAMRLCGAALERMSRAAQTSRRQVCSRPGRPYDTGTERAATMNRFLNWLVVV